MSVIPADPATLVKCLGRRHGGPRGVISERDVPMNEIANGLHSFPAWPRVAEMGPRHFGEMIGIAVSAAEQVREDCIRQRFHLQLGSLGHRGLRRATITDHGIRFESYAARRSDESSAAVAEAIP